MYGGGPRGVLVGFEILATHEIKCYVLAIEFQQRVIDAWEGHGPSAYEELREAQRILTELKKKARGATSNELITKALPLPHSTGSAPTRNLPSDVPVDEKRSNVI
ncbi:hypothetical protein CK203_008865 [Vitis vinifera]|uniref:Uncharacterized protein n=1 Tax=Vitis vinifera TaxID=29760 RepID=A0A438KDC2_VITVI|nr:hypothetical protein CK203_008865 [Vitis vinifera]